MRKCEARWCRNEATVIFETTIAYDHGYRQVEVGLCEKCFHERYKEAPATMS
jgi:hypothetical protein